MIRHAEIAGAGFAGLTAAIALAQRGWTVRVHERSSSIRAEGFGITLHPNGLKVLEGLGVLDTVLQGAMRVSRQDRYNDRGEIAATFPVKQTYRVSRHHLISELESKARSLSVEIQTSSSAVAASEAGELILKDGQRLKADLIVGADGYLSQVRESLGLMRRRVWLKDGAMRMIIPRSDLEPVHEPRQGAPSSEYWSGTRRMIYSPCSPDEVYIAMTCLIEDTAAKAIPIDPIVWRQSFPAHTDLIDRILTQTAWETVKYVPFQVIHLKQWSKGKVAIVGDAANAMPPNLGQGGGVAMMNAWALAVALENAVPVEEALRHWERRERDLTDHTQRWSRLYSSATLWPPALRAIAFKAVERNAWVRSRYHRTANAVPAGWS
ncbi:MAG: FAD-dependent monooxygenase [Pigmentiphaga sp.]|nr:FAD-dependent monooxygenase [Pigmentiphaga sp.]